MCNLVRRATQNLEKVAKNPVEKIASNPVTSVAVMVFSALNKRYHPFQNHYTHEIIIFELFRRLQLQLSAFQGSSELITITVTVSLFFSCRMELQEIIPLRNSQELSAITVT